MKDKNKTIDAYWKMQYAGFFFNALCDSVYLVFNFSLYSIVWVVVDVLLLLSIKYFKLNIDPTMKRSVISIPLLIAFTVRAVLDSRNLTPFTFTGIVIVSIFRILCCLMLALSEIVILTYKQHITKIQRN